MLSKLLKSLFVLLALLTGSLLILALVVIEDAPALQPRGAPTPEDVMTARAFVSDVKAAASPGQGDAPPLVTTEAELSSLVRLGVRLIPGFRGEVAVEPGRVAIRAALPVDLPGATRWLNLAVTVPEFEAGLTLGRVTLGPVAIPPALALELGRVGANLILGDGLGDRAVRAASRMHVAGDTVTVDLEIDRVGENGIIGGLFGALRGGQMPPDALVDSYHVRIREAMDRGDLPVTGSYLPYLVFTLTAAHQGASSQGASDAFTAAIFALTRICGAHDFQLLFGDVVTAGSAAARAWDTDCGRLTLNDRIDSRRHFTTAAAIQAASNRNVSVSVGEYKELRDTLKSGGFDFTDLAANNSGIRLADVFMGTPADRWPDLIARIKAEGDVIVPYDDIPQIMTGEEFSTRFGGIDSDSYTAILNMIETRIDGLALHAPL